MKESFIVRSSGQATQPQRVSVSVHCLRTFPWTCRSDRGCTLRFCRADSIWEPSSPRSRLNNPIALSFHPNRARNLSRVYCVNKCVWKRGRVLRAREPFIISGGSTDPCVCGFAVVFCPGASTSIFNPAKMNPVSPALQGGEKRKALGSGGVKNRGLRSVPPAGCSSSAGARQGAPPPKAPSQVTRSRGKTVRSANHRRAPRVLRFDPVPAAAAPSLSQSRTCSFCVPQDQRPAVRVTPTNNKGPPIPACPPTLLPLLQGPAVMSSSSPSSSSPRPSPLPRFAYALADTSAAADADADAAGRHDDNKDDTNNVRLIDAAAAIAAAELINKRNVQANSSAIDIYPLPVPDAPEAPDTPRLTSSPTSLPPSTSTSTIPSNASSTPLVPSGSRLQFLSNTIAPSPPPPPRHDPKSISPSPQAHHLGTSRLSHGADHTNSFVTPSRISVRPSLTLQRKTSTSSLNLKPISRTPSLKTSLSGIFGSPSAASSTYPSPVISAMGDVTPLPSPLLSNGSPGPWKKFDKRPSASYNQSQTESDTPTSPEGTMSFTPTNRKGYPGLSSGSGAGGISMAVKSQNQQNGQSHHTRNRSISDYVPDPTLIPKRMVTVSGSHATGELKGAEAGRENHMRREPHLSEARGLTPVEKPPTPPRSESSHSVSDQSAAETPSKRSSIEPSRYEYFEAYDRCDGKRRRWRAIGQLGQGTFSRVMLATSQMVPSASERENPNASNGLIDPKKTSQYDRKTLVAIKVCEHGPRGGASEERIEMSLKRELEIMQIIRHPSLIHLKAWNIESTRAILVLSYCAGGDLFDLANGHRSLLRAGLLRRIFAEIVGAVLYLHDQLIVHRDIKLESRQPRLLPVPP